MWLLDLLTHNNATAKSFQFSVKFDPVRSRSNFRKILTFHFRLFEFWFTAMSFLLIVWLWFVLVHVAAFLYDIGEYETFIINPANNHTINLTIHYPISTIKPSNSTSTRKETTFPSIIFSHGWTCKNTFYDYIWQNLVPQGYIVVMPNDDTTIIIDEFLVNYAAGQLATLDWLIDVANNNDDEDNPLYGLINPYSAACSGHSMGGGACLLSMSDRNSNDYSYSYSYDYDYNFFNYSYEFKHRFSSGFLLSGCNWNPSSRIAAYNISQPIFFLTGNGDCMCEPFLYADRYYSHVPDTTCKYLANINNGTHCNFEEAGIYTAECDALQLELCIQNNYTIVKSIKNSQQWDITNRYMIDFFNASLIYNSTNQKLYQNINQMLENDFVNDVLYDVKIGC